MENGYFLIPRNSSPSLIGNQVGILHIGTHKTGTTSFQSLLTECSTIFAECGIHVYKNSFVDNGQAIELPLLTIDDTKCAPTRQVFGAPSSGTEVISWQTWVRAQLTSSGGHLLASHEELSFLRTDNELQNLRNLLPGQTFKIILVARNPSSFAQSWCNELQRMERNGVETHTRCSEFLRSVPFLTDIEGIAAMYRRHFGFSSVSVVDFDSEVKKCGSVLPALLRETGVDPDFFPDLSHFWSNSSRKPKLRLRVRRKLKKTWRSHRQR